MRPKAKTDSNIGAAFGNNLKLNKSNSFRNIMSDTDLSKRHLPRFRLQTTRQKQWQILVLTSDASEATETLKMYRFLNLLLPSTEA